MKTFSERLKATREEKGLSQRALAKLVGLKNQSSIGNMEQAGRSGSRYIAALAQALGVSPLWLESGKGAKHPVDMGQNLPVHVGNEISTTPNTTGGVNLSPDLIQVIEWYQGMGPRNQARAMAQLHLWYLNDQEDERPSIPGARVYSQGEPLEGNQKGHDKRNRKAAK